MEFDPIYLSIYAAFVSTILALKQMLPIILPPIRANYAVVNEATNIKPNNHQRFQVEKKYCFWLFNKKDYPIGLNCIQVELNPRISQEEKAKDLIQFMLSFYKIRLLMFEIIFKPLRVVKMFRRKFFHLVRRDEHSVYFPLDNYILKPSEPVPYKKSIKLQYKGINVDEIDSMFVIDSFGRKYKIKFNRDLLMSPLGFPPF